MPLLGEVGSKEARKLGRLDLSQNDLEQLCLGIALRGSVGALRGTLGALGAGWDLAV